MSHGEHKNRPEDFFSVILRRDSNHKNTCTQHTKINEFFKKQNVNDIDTLFHSSLVGKKEIEFLLYFFL